MNVLNDGKLDIATGRSRRELNWKNKEILWSELLTRLSTTHRTPENYAEYLVTKKLRQDEIKDIGGFVGGYLASGKRKAGAVVHRQLITLDIDFAPGGIWEDFMLLYDNAAALYSTHKHSPEAPRLRLLLPLDRAVAAAEYVAIARRIAGNLGIEYFDPTTFEPSRLMYWPSTSKDGIYEYEYQDGPWLNADELLSTYRDWKDSSEWPVSERAYTIVQRAIKKQGDPLDKPGLIGAWCRTYTIHDVITAFLGDIYEPCDTPGRYTYKDGSTAAGLVVYDDKYAYSHHGTDPISNKLCNAFDLVRLHKYGLKDEDARDGTPGNKLPSYVEMTAFATRDPVVRKQLGAERLADAKGDFAGMEEVITEAVSTDWMAQLEVDRKGNYYSTINNMVLILENDANLRDSLAFDEFESRPVVLRNLPWRKVDHRSRYLIDRDIDNLEHYLETVYTITSSKLEKALSVMYEKKQFHPIRDYLTGLQWDGQDRVDDLLIDYFGADDSDYVKTVTRKTLVAAVARVFQPGIKFDYILTLIGEQGKKKSTLFSMLGRQWFTDTFHLNMLQSKEGYEQLRGVWLVEIAEMSGLARTEIERLKGFVSAREDRYRQAYGRRTENFPRQCVFFGTTNKPDFLRDQTGNRRFWPVEISSELATKDVFTDFTDEEINQVWAEALMFYRKGETLYLAGDMEQAAAEVQSEHTEEHPWTGVIDQYLNIKLPDNWSVLSKYERLSYLQGDELQAEGTVERDRVCVLEIWAEALNKREVIDEKSTGVIRNIMRNMRGWNEQSGQHRYHSYGRQRRGWFRSKIGVSRASHLSQG